MWKGSQVHQRRDQLTKIFSINRQSSLRFSKCSICQGQVKGTYRQTSYFEGRSILLFNTDEGRDGQSHRTTTCFRESASNFKFYLIYNRLKNFSYIRRMRSTINAKTT